MDETHAGWITSWPNISFSKSCCRFVAATYCLKFDANQSDVLNFWSFCTAHLTATTISSISGLTSHDAHDAHDSRYQNTVRPNTAQGCQMIENEVLTVRRWYGMGGDAENRFQWCRIWRRRERKTRAERHVSDEQTSGGEHY